MIEFKGELSGASLKFLIKRQIEGQAIASLITTGLFSVPIIFASIYLHLLALVVFVPHIVMVIGSLIPPGKKARSAFVPNRIFIDKTEMTVVHQCDKMERFHMMSSVKKIVDYGEWYHFVFFYSDRDDYFVCQKSLLTKGSLEEFEAMFEGKIIRKFK